MAKSKYEIWLSQGSEKLRLPVLPEAINLSSNMQNDSVEVDKLGELTFIKQQGSKQISFDSFFPLHRGPYCEYNGFPSPENCIQRIEKWRNKNEPIRIIVTGTKINFNCSLEAFDWSEGESGIGDRDYSISLKEYKMATPRKVKVKTKPAPAPAKRPAKKPDRHYVVKRGDTLWAIAGRMYGRSLDWRKIWNANRAMMIRRDSRNNRMPGHWIFPGQRLVIPA